MPPGADGHAARRSAAILVRVERDEFVRQGRVLADMVLREAGARAAEHSDQLRDALGALAGFVNDQTGGRYADQVGRAADFVEHGVDLLAAQAPEQQAGPSAPPPGGPSAGPDGPSEGPSGGPEGPSGTRSG